MRSYLLITLLTITLSIPVLTVAAPDEVPGETLVTMEITGMT